MRIVRDAVTCLKITEVPSEMVAARVQIGGDANCLINAAERR